MNFKRFKKVMSIITVIIFGTMICVPLFNINTLPDKISELENKKLAKMPQLGGGGVNSTYITAFNNYIDDNIGFKEQIVMLRLNWMYQLFRNIDSPKYIMGKDGHLFYTDGGKMIDTFQGKDKLSNQEMERFYNAVQNAKTFFESTGAKFYMVGIPDKEQIYPDFYPDNIIRYTNTSKSEDLINYIQQKDSETIAYLKDSLLEAKQKESEKLLYYKNFDSTHWNAKGAFIGYQQIMNRLKKDFPQLKVLSEEDILFSSKKSEGSSSLFSHVEALAKIYNFDDDIYYSRPKEGYKAVNLEEPAPEGIKDYFHFVNESMPDAPKLLVMCDSYVLSFLRYLLPESFSEVYFMNRIPGDKLAAFQEQVKADIVLIEFVERAFDYDSYVVRMEQIQESN